MTKNLKTALRILSMLLKRIASLASRESRRRSCAAYRDRFCDGTDCSDCQPIARWETENINPITTNP